MARLPTLKPRLKMANTSRVSVPTVSGRRITGSRLQKRRFSLWRRDPHCAGCGRVVAYPGGFELDHITPLYQGGEDTEANCQILCVEYVDGQKAGCHVAKTASDLKPPG